MQLLLNSVSYKTKQKGNNLGKALIRKRDLIKVAGT